MISTVVNKNREHCVGAKVPARAAYYTINEKDQDVLGADAVAVRIRNSFGKDLIYEYDVDLSRRTFSRTKVTEQ